MGKPGINSEAALPDQDRIGLETRVTKPLLVLSEHDPGDSRLVADDCEFIQILFDCVLFIPGCGQSGSSPPPAIAGAKPSDRHSVSPIQGAARRSKLDPPKWMLQGGHAMPVGGARKPQAGQAQHRIAFGNLISVIASRKWRERGTESGFRGEERLNNQP
jgi:hypothetical protein